MGEEMVRWVVSYGDGVFLVFDEKNPNEVGEHFRGVGLKHASLFIKEEGAMRWNNRLRTKLGLGTVEKVRVSIEVISE